jgi:rhodanese-related sulfurtransferase
MKTAFLLLFAIPSAVFAQFKNDNVLYKTIFWEDFCKEYNKREALLLDVRSKGEYDDTSRSAGLNIGHLKGAKHINVMELGNRIHELDAYKDKPVYIYCSHSQRSRRSSKMLVDSGFTNVININGGLTDLYMEDANDLPCKTSMIETANGYTQLNAKEVYDLLHVNKTVQVIDLRKDSIYNGWSGNAKDRAMGKMKNAINIPLANLDKWLDRINKDKQVLLVDAGGDESAKAASLLVANGYKNVSIVFNGLDGWLALPEENKKWTTSLLQQNIAYRTLDAPTFDRMAAQDVIIIDVRKEDEFNNKATTAWRNRGHIKNAINMPVDKIESAYTSISQEKPIIIYSFSNTLESYQAAEFFASKGFGKVYVLAPGIWGLRYQAYNNPGSSRFKDWVVDIPEENL